MIWKENKHYKDQESTAMTLLGSKMNQGTAILESLSMHS